MNQIELNNKLTKLYNCKLQFGALRLDTKQSLPSPLHTKTKVPLYCEKCSARSQGPEQFRSLDNLRAIKNGRMGIGCAICKTIEDTENVCSSLLQQYSITMMFLVTSFNVTELKVQLSDAESGLAIGNPIHHYEIRNIAYGNRQLYGMYYLNQIRKDAAPTIQEFRTNFPKATIKYIGYYKHTKTASFLNYFNITFPSGILLRDPEGLVLLEQPASKIRKIIKQQKSDQITVRTFKAECKLHNAEFVKCLGRQSNMDESLKRGSSLYFEYITQSKLIKQNTLTKAQECGFQQTPRRGERMVIAICRGLFPYGEWRANVRPFWNISPTFKKPEKTSRLEVDVLSDRYKIGVERQSKYHTEQVDPKRCPDEVERYNFQDPIKKNNIERHGYKFIEIKTEGLDLKAMVTEFETQLGIVATEVQLDAIEAEWREFVKDAYRQYKIELLSTLAINRCKLISPNRSSCIAPRDRAIILLPCGHENENTMSYFKQGNGLKMCKSCRAEFNIKRSRKEREVELKKQLGLRWNTLPESVRKELVSHTLKQKIICPQCNTPVSLGNTLQGLVEFIDKHDGFYCIHCHNTGKSITDNAHIAGTVLQFKASVEQIIETTGWGDPKLWSEYVSISSSTLDNHEVKNDIIVTLACTASHILSYPISSWRKIISSKKRSQRNNYCDQCIDLPKGNGLGEEVHLARMRKIHPKATFAKKPSSDGLIPFRCNEIESIGEFTIQHPVFYTSLGTLVDDAQKKCPAEFDYCLGCAVSNLRVAPRGHKRIEQHLSRLQMRASVIAQITGSNSISAVSVSKMDMSKTGSVTCNERLNFQCHNPEHPPIVHTSDYLFNRSNKGYCPLCLKKAGVKLFKELSDKY